jgi:hypothetical protein
MTVNRFYDNIRWSDDGERGLIEMCDYGAQLVADGKGDATRLDVFNRDEAEFVKCYMNEKHPTTPYSVTRVV